MIDVNELRKGVTFELDGELFKVLEYHHHKPGRGSATIRVKTVNLRTGTIREQTFTSSDRVQDVRLDYHNVQYLYNDGEAWHFMHPDSFEQIAADANVVGDSKYWLKEQDTCIITLWNDAPIAVTPPNHVVLKIVETDPGVRGDTATGGTKPATCETGAVVKVPLFLEEGDLIKVDTRTGEYQGRAKE